MSTPRANSIDVLITVWVCFAITTTVLLFRIFGRIIKKKEAYLDDWLSILAIFLLTGRCIVIHFSLILGSNNVDHPETLSAEDIKRRAVGSKLLLASRIFFAGLISVWVMKWNMTEFYERLTHRLPGYRMPLKLVKILLILCLCGVVVSTFVECRPFNHYWQVYPYPGAACTQARAQLLTMGICNISTDIILIIIPLPVIFSTQLPMLKKISLAMLFCIGFFVVALTILKMPIIVQNANVVRQRSLWASLEMLACCVVVNFPVLLTYVKKSKRDNRNSREITKRYSDNFAPSSPRRLLHDKDKDLEETQDEDPYHQLHAFPPPAVMRDMSDRNNNSNNNRFVIEVSRTVDLEKCSAKAGRVLGRNTDSEREETITTNIWTGRESGVYNGPSPAGSSHSVTRF